VSEETRGSLVSQYFNGRDDVLENLAKNYYELFCKAAIKKDGAFKEFVVTGLTGLKTQGIITNEAVKNVEKYLEEITENLKRRKEAESRQFLITSDLNEVDREISEGNPKIGYVERDEIEEVKEALKTTNKLIVVGKPGAGKTRFMMRVLKDLNYDRFVVIRNFFGEGGITTLDAELQEFDSFAVVWDDIHQADDDLVKSAINQIGQLARESESEKKFLFVGTSRTIDKYYGFEPEEKNILLKDFRNVELGEECSAYFGVSVEVGVTEKILEVGDGTPFYVISLFATLKEQGKKELTLEDLGTLPEDSLDIWCKHLKFLEGKGELSTSEKNVLRGIALAMRAVPAIDFEVLEKFYEKIFRGDLSEFDYALKDVVKKFFIGIEGESCSMHAVQDEVVEGKYPVEKHNLERLIKVLALLEKERSLKLLWGFAGWSCRNNNYKDCLALLNGFVEKEPNFAAAYNNRGNAYSELNQLEAAIEEYSKAIELNPEDAEAYYNRGNVYRKLKRYTRAIEEYSRAIEKNPNFAIAYGNRGVSYRILSQYENAFKDYNKVIELNPNDFVAYNNRGYAYAQLNQHETAIKDYDKAIGLNPNYVEAYNNRGIAYAQVNQRGGAIEDFNKAIELNPEDATAYYNRGLAYVESNQHNKAIEEYDKVIKLNPNDAAAYNSRGVTYATIGKYDESARDFKRGGILFLKSARRKDVAMSFTACFTLRDKIENDDVVYCGLVLYLLDLNADVIIKIREMQVEDEALKEILNLTLRKLNGEDISEEINKIEYKEEREEMKILLDMLKIF
jgi:tetratricopeptide (TPR) repeat protein